MNRPCKITMLVVALGLLILLVAAWPDTAPWPEIDRVWRVEIVAHRGGLIERPESTLVAYDHAVDVGADWLELDVHLSADGRAVIIHDDTVDRTTNGQGRVAELTLAELRRLDAAYHWPDDIPDTERRFAPFSAADDWRGRGLTLLTLDEFLQRYRSQRLMIEIKPPGEAVVEAVLADLERHGRTRSILLASFHEDTLASVRRRAPEVATVASPRESRSFLLLASVGLARFWPRRAAALAIPPTLGTRDLLNTRLLDAARRRGLSVYVWTINDPEHWDDLIDRGVTGILTDRPAALNAQLQARRLMQSEKEGR